MRRRRSGAGSDLAAEGCGVVALGDAADLVGDADPAVAAILAHMHGALGVTNKELVAAGPARHSQRLDIGAGRHSEALWLGVPAAPVIAAPIEADACRHEHRVRPRRQQHHLVHRARAPTLLDQNDTFI
jgi:hypothetical protein